MKTLKKLSIALFVTTLIFSHFACEKETVANQNTVNQNLPQFNMDTFEQNIIDAIEMADKQAVGWGYAITQDGKLKRADAFGFARLLQDGVLPFSTSTKHYQASVSKFYTAVAAMQLIYAKGLTVDSEIEPFLPQTWTRGNGVYALTFKDLLKHESGLVSNNSDLWGTCDYDGVREAIKTGVDNPKERDYLNVNFALFRILIPAMWKGMDGAPYIDLNSETSVASAFVEYLQKNVFEKAGLQNISTDPGNRMNCCLYYSADDLGTANKGTYYTDRFLIAGGGGFYLSVIEMAVMNAYFNHTEAFVSSEVRDIMREHHIGFEPWGSGDEIHGDYFPKDGSNGSSDPFVQGMRTQIVQFTGNGVEVALAMNCTGVDVPGGSLRQMLYDAYNDAWVIP